MKYAIAFGAAVVLALAGYAGALLGGHAVQQSAAQSTQLGSAFALGTREFPGNDPATTTRQYLNGTTHAKSSFIIPIDEADLIDLYLMAEASSTTAVLDWELSFSNNYDTATGNGDWYCADASSVAIASTTHNGTTCHEDQWTPGTVSTSTKNVSVSPTAAKFARVRFYANTGDLSIHAEANVRKPVAR